MVKKRVSTGLLFGVLFFKFTRGDVLTTYYRSHGYGYSYTGICLSVRKKSMQSANTCFILRNVFAKIAVEFRVSLFNTSRLFLKLLDYARKQSCYVASKLYFLRVKMNQASLVKV